MPCHIYCPTVPSFLWGGSGGIEWGEEEISHKIIGLHRSRVITNGDLSTPP